MATVTHELSIVTEATVREVATPQLVMEAVRTAFVETNQGTASIFPVALGAGTQEGSTFGVKSGRTANGVLGAKIGTYWPANPASGLPAHGSTTLLFDGETGLPNVVVNAGYLNGLRTAAADAVAVDALARNDAQILCLVGAGGQAAFDARLIALVRPLSEIRIWSRNMARAEGLKASLADLDVAITTVDSVERGLDGADIVSTVTPSRSALVDSKWVAAGTHVSAMGADKPGKQELDVTLVKRGLLFADQIEQSFRIGEFQHIAQDPDVSVVTLGALLVGEATGRTDAHDITIFDSSGLATQDIHVARSVAQAAADRGLLTRICF